MHILLVLALLSRLERGYMKTKLILIVSILILVVAIFFLWEGNNNTVGTALLFIGMLLNIIRGLINVWNERRLK